MSTKRTKRHHEGYVYSPPPSVCRTPRGAGAVRRALLICWAAAVCGLMPAADSFAGTTGKISGRITDGRGEPLGGANVAIPAAQTGAISEIDGRFLILGVPAGTYEIRVNLLGYRATLIQEVVVSADQTTELNVQLEEAPIEIEEVVITSERPVVDLGLTSNIATVTRKEIDQLPVQELQDVVNLQAGVVDGHFRGGRIGEVQYQVDGVTVNNPFNNESGIRLDRSLLEEVQVISGTFDAEYGQAMSGVVNAVLRRGSDRFQWEAEAYGGTYAFNEADRLVDNHFTPGGIGNYRINLSGPTGLPETRFMMSGRYASLDDWVTGERRFVPTDESAFDSAIFRPTGDGETVPLGYLREWSGVAQVSNRSIPNMELGYQALFANTETRRSNNAWRLNPDGLSEQRNWSIVHGLDATYTLSPTSYVTFAGRHNFVDYYDRRYPDLYDSRYDEAGPPEGSDNYEDGAIIQGVEFTRYTQTTSSLVYKGSYVTQLSSDQQIKLGVEAQNPHLEFGPDGHLDFATVDGVEQLVRHENEPPDFPGTSTYDPRFFAAYAQDELEWNDLKVRAGLRFDYFSARATVPSDLRNPANSIDGVPMSMPVPTSVKMTFAPRLGVAYPVTTDAALSFAYGHFSQMPALGTIFSNADYSVLTDLQAGGISYGVLGNPDIKPEQTVQYQFGYKQALSPWLGVDLTTFYKDIRDLLGVEFITTYNNAEYARLTNVDFGNVIGFTVALDRRSRGLFGMTIDYTWQTALGNSSDPRETATRAEAGEDPRPRQIPLNWDQTHTLNVTATLARPDDFAVSTVVKAASGQPYTPIVETGFGGGLQVNSGRKPAVLLVDARGEKSFQFGALPTSFFARVYNVFDTRFFNGFVFGSTGSPYYSRSAGDVNTLSDPTRFYGARRIEVGFVLRGGGS